MSNKEFNCGQRYQWQKEDSQVSDSWHTTLGTVLRGQEHRREFIWFFLIVIFICINVLPSDIWRPEKGARPQRTRVKDSCEPPRGCWELNSGPLQNQLSPLTKEASSPQPPIYSNFETGSPVVQSGLNLDMQTMMTMNSDPMLS